MGEQKPLGKTPLGGNPSPEMTYLPTSNQHVHSLSVCCLWLMLNLAYLAHGDDFMHGKGA